jgi:hypothetical protein
MSSQALLSYLELVDRVAVIGIDDYGIDIDTTYHLLTRIAKERADELRVNDQQFEWRKNGKILGSFPSKLVKTSFTLNYEGAFKLILERDKNVANYVIRIGQPGKESIYQIRQD